jgi:hypothetical protein
MELPPNWAAAPEDPSHFAEQGKSDDNLGGVEVIPLQGAAFEPTVNTMLDEAFQSEVVSRSTVEISGKNAILATSHGRYYVMELNIHDDGRIIRVAFRTMPADFAAQQDPMRTALLSTQLR